MLVKLIPGVITKKWTKTAIKKFIKKNFCQKVSSYKNYKYWESFIWYYYPLQVEKKWKIMHIYIFMSQLFNKVYKSDFNFTFVRYSYIRPLILNTVCPRSRNPFYIVSYYKVTWTYSTSWTHSKYVQEIDTDFVK